MANETTLPHSSRNLSSLPQFNLTFTFLNQKQPMSCACAVCACKVEDCDSEEKVVRWLLSYGALAFSSTMCGIYDSEGKRHSFTARQLGEHFKLKVRGGVMGMQMEANCREARNQMLEFHACFPIFRKRRGQRRMKKSKCGASTALHPSFTPSTRCAVAVC
eukprot:scaffold81506_cov17-Tisochrysis_lutea.AAC.1